MLFRSQMESGQLKLHPESLELGDLVVDLTDSFVENNHRLRIKCDTPSLVCELDPNVFRQIVFNLVSNALKFSPANEPVEIEIVADDVQIRLCVRDYGLGIPPEERTQLGSPFYRGSNVTDVAGTGLGFAIVSRGLALCGGTFSIESELKKGTTIHVSLPQAKQNSIGHQMTGSEDYVSEQPARPN